MQNYTACPNQVVTVNATWPNVAITSMTLVIPTGGSATNNGALQANTTFTISHPGPGPITSWTLNAAGIGNNGPTTSSTIFQLQIIQPPPLNYTIANGGDVCPGGTATIIAEPGGNAYSLMGAQNLGTFATNVILIPNVTQQHSGQYTITSLGSCTLVNTLTISVSPNPPLAVTAPTNVCEGSVAYITGNMPGASIEWLSPSNQTFNQGAVGAPGIPSSDGVWTAKATWIYGNVICTKSATTSISVVMTEKPNVSASPTSQLCQNEKLSLLADAGNQATNYSWTGPCGFSSSATSPTVAGVLPCNNGYYVATAFFSNGNITCSQKDSIRVYVVATDVPNTTIPAAVCQNTNVVMTASTTSIPANSWIWYGPSFSATPNPSVTLTNVQPSNSGPYLVTAVFSMAGVSRTCGVNSTPKQLLVIQVNSVQVIPSQPVCTPNNGQLAASAPGALQFDWEGPNGHKYSGSNVTVYYPTPSYSGIYTVTAYFGSLKCPSSNTVELNVHQTLNFALVPALHPKCWGDSILLAGPPGADSYSWTSSTGFSANTRTILINELQPKHAGTYTVTVADGPCISKSFTEITVRPPVQWTLTPGDRNVCKGDTVILEVGTNYDPHVYIEWNPELYLDSKDGPRKVVIPMGTVQYNVKARDLGCNTPYEIQHTFFLNVLPVPEPTLNLVSNRGCAPFTQLFNAQTYDSAALVTYDFGGLDQVVQTDSIGVWHTFTEPGTYEVYVITKGKNHCTESWKYPLDVIADPRPGSDFTWNPDPATTSSEVEFSATSTYEPLAYRTWFFNGGKPAIEDTIPDDSGVDTSVSKHPRRLYPEAGRYVVMLVSANDLGCWDTVVKVVPVIDEMFVYIPDAFTPNGDGINDGFTVYGQGIDKTGFLMYIFNRKGQLVYSSTNIDEPWDGTANGKDCQDGVYTYKIRIIGLNGEGRKDFVGHVTLIK